MLDINACGGEPHPIDQASEKPRPLPHAPITFYDFARNNAVVARLRIVLHVREVAKQPIKYPRQQAFYHGISASAASGNHDLVAFPGLGVEPRDFLRSVL